MLKNALLLLGALLIFVQGICCTTFFIHRNGQMVFGRNYDWVTETGMVNSNLRGQEKTSLQPGSGKKFKWVSKYGSVTFNQYGKEFPTGGMNEKGLVVELMWLSESRFPDPDQRPALSVLQWIQYQLDQCATIEEVIATDNRVRIESNGAPQHYLVADALGNAATIEFLQGKMVVHKGASLPHAVLTNSTYEESLMNIERSATRADSATNHDNSLARFDRICRMANAIPKEYEQSLTDYSFQMLDAVAQGSFTKWSIVYDITSKKIHFRTFSHQTVKSIDLTAFDLSCRSTTLALNVSQAQKGDVTKKFSAYTNEMNKKMLKQAFANSRSRIQVDATLQNAMADNAAAVRCTL